jgi:hypothetical protein
MPEGVGAFAPRPGDRSATKRQRGARKKHHHWIIAMKYLPAFLLLGLVGCAASTETLILEARVCAATYVDERGFIGKPGPKARQQCWAKVNQRMEAIVRRERDRKSTLKCHEGAIAWCDSRFRGTRRECQCVSVHEVQRVFEGLGW